MRWAKHVALMWEKKNVHRVLVGKLEVKRSLERFRNRWKDNIKIYPNVVGWEGADWINLAQDRHNLKAFVKGLMTLGGLWKFKPLMWCADIL